MPYTKDQLKAYWQANKEILNQKRRQKRRLAKLGLAMEKVSQKKVSHKSQMANLKTANLNPVSRGKPVNGKPNLGMANLKLTRLIKKWQTHTNYSCVSTCAYSYCSNCWYFEKDNLLDYKEAVR